MKKTRHRIEVVARRRVAVPAAGPDAYTSDSKSKVFPFGRQQELKTGDSARAAATAYAETLLSESSEVQVITWNGYSGYPVKLKDDRTSLFPTLWDGSVYVPSQLR